MKKALVYISLTLLLISCKNKVAESIQPEIKNITESVYASGTIYPKNDYQIFSTGDGILTQIFIEEGNDIHKNTLLYAIESDVQNAKLDASKNAYSIAQDNQSINSNVVAELETALRIAKEKFQYDSINFFRIDRLYKQEAISKAEFDKAKLQFQVSKNDIIAKQKLIQKTKNQLKLELSNAKSQYNLATIDKDNFLIKSKTEGVLFETYKKVGELVRRGELLGLAGSGNEVYIKLSVDEPDIAMIALGQKVLVKVDLYKDKIFEAKIEKIYPVLNKIDRTFRVDAVFVGEKPKVFYGLNMEANIIVKEKKNCLTIPKSFVIGNDSIWVERNGKEQVVKITKGIEDMDRIEILSGVTKSDKIIRK